LEPKAGIWIAEKAQAIRSKKITGCLLWLKNFALTVLGYKI